MTPRKKRHKANPLSWLPSEQWVSAAKSIALVAGILGPALGVRMEAGVKNAEAVGGSQAAASLAVFTSIRLDSLESTVARQARHIRALERKTYRGRLPTALELYGPPEPPREMRRRKLFGIF